MARGVDFQGQEDEEIKPFAVDEGAETQMGDPEWQHLRPMIGMVLECHMGSSSLGLLEEEWFAVAIGAVQNDSKQGLLLEGELLGCEDSNQEKFIGDHLEGGIHLCTEEICGEESGKEMGPIHVKKVRCWTVGNFKASYLSASGKKTLKEMRSEEKKKALALTKAKAKASSAPSKVPKKKPARAGPGDNKQRKPPKKNEVISLESGDSQEDPGEERSGKPAGMSRAGLKELFQKAKEKMTGGPRGRQRVEESEDSSGGRKPKRSRHAREETRLVSGTNFRPDKMTPLAIEDAGTKGGDKSKWMRKKMNSKDPGDMLLAQAAQHGPGPKERRKKKEKKGGKKMIELLKKAVGGKKDKKKKKKKKKKRKIKKDPDDPGGSGSSGSSSSASSSSSSQEPGSESDSDLSLEPPLRKKALSSPGSVLADLIKHAQEQLDKGALMDHEGQPASLTSGIKLSTYFALLIRPNFPNNHPLLRELYQLAQSIDLLRLGRLAETGDALASRFVAVHTALSDGNWQVASQLELFPLERVQSTSTSTMLQAQRHRRLLWKAQGFSSRVYGLGRGGWSKGGDEEKGGAKGGKGKVKGKGKGKGAKHGGKDWWNNAAPPEGDNPWKENKEEAPKKA